MILKRTILVIALLSLPILLAGADTSERAEGVVTKARGELRAISASGGSRPLAQGSRVFAGDVVSASERSSCIISLGDGSEISIAPGSRVRINNSLANPRGSSSIAVYAGMIWASVFGDDENPADFTVETPTTVVGVRGTKLAVAVAADGLSRVGVEKGEVGAEGSGGTSSVKAGNALDIGFGKNPSPGSFKDSGRAWSSFFDDGSKRFKENPDKSVGDLLGAMLKSRKDAESGLTGLIGAFGSYKSLRDAIEKKSRIVVPEDDKKKLAGKAIEVLKLARKLQLFADRSSACAELLRRAAADEEKDPGKYRGKAGLFRDAMNQIGKLDPDAFQKKVSDVIEKICEELEHDIMRFGIAPDLKRLSARKKKQNIDNAAGKGGNPNQENPPGGRTGIPGDHLDTPPIPAPEPGPSPEPSPAPQPQPPPDQQQPPTRVSPNGP